MANEHDERGEGERETRELVDRGADLAGALTGGAIGLVGGPAGALGGAAIGVAVTHAVKNVADRLHARQADRAGAAIAVLVDDQEERRMRGESPRGDGFFEPRGALRPEAEELLEAVLLHAANSYEERKVPLLAHLYDAVAHDESVSAADAHALLALAERLTYRQLVALSVLADETHFRRLAHAATLRDEGRGSPTPTLAVELDALGADGLIGARVDARGPFRAGEVFGTAGPASGWSYGTSRLLPAGVLLHRMMRLDTIDKADREQWLEDLTGAEPGA